MSDQAPADFSINMSMDGPSDGPFVVFGHALGADRTMWESTIAALRDKYRTVTIDWRGHGKTSATPPPYDMDTLALDLLKLTKLVIPQDFVFVGCSMSGMLGQMLGINHGHMLRGLVLCSTTSRVPPETAPVWQERIDTARQQGMEALVEGTVERWFTEETRNAGSPAIDQVRAMIRNTSVDGYVGWCEAIRNFEVTGLLGLIERPTLVVHGRQDPAMPVEAAQTLAQGCGARLEIIDNASHMLPMERPDAFNKLLREFLDGLY